MTLYGDSSGASLFGAHRTCSVGTTSTSCDSSPTSTTRTTGGGQLYENVDEFYFQSDQNVDTYSVPVICSQKYESSQSRSDLRSQAPRIDFLNHIPPPPLPRSNENTLSDRSSNYCGTRKRAFDQRPLSVAAHERRRKSSHTGLISFLAISTLFVFVGAFLFWYFFDNIQERLRNMQLSL